MILLTGINTDFLPVFDIETSSQYPSFSEAPPEIQDAFMYTFPQYRVEEDLNNNDFRGKCALSPVFCKIVCLCVKWGSIDKLTEITGTDKEIVSEFFRVLHRYNQKHNPSNLIAGHNIKGFDLPIVLLKALANGVQIPKYLDHYGKKPWEIKNIVDSKEMLTGSYSRLKGFNLTSLCAVFGIESPKDGISGKDVPSYYWNNVDAPKVITEYCSKDVVANHELIVKLKNYAE